MQLITFRIQHYKTMNEDIVLLDWPAIRNGASSALYEAFSNCASYGPDALDLT